MQIREIPHPHEVVKKALKLAFEYGRDIEEAFMHGNTRTVNAIHAEFAKLEDDTIATLEKLDND